MNWTTNGDAITNGRRGEIEAMCNALAWEPLPVTFPACQGLAIQAMIDEFDLKGRVVGVAYSDELAPYSLVAVRASGYKGGNVEIFGVDRGSDLPIIASRQIADNKGE